MHLIKVAQKGYVKGIVESMATTFSENFAIGILKIEAIIKFCSLKSRNSNKYVHMFFLLSVQSLAFLVNRRGLDWSTTIPPFSSSHWIKQRVSRIDIFILVLAKVHSLHRSEFLIKM
jgi:hypothetical protein